MLALRLLEEFVHASDGLAVRLRRRRPAHLELGRRGEEAAYFYLFGVLAAEAVRSGRLGPNRPNGYVNGSRGPGPDGAAETASENVSKYLRSRKLPKSPSRAVMVN